jgi:hypothetical protein
VELYWQGKKPKNSEINLSQCHFVTNPTWIDPGANPGLRDERPEPLHGRVEPILKGVLSKSAVQIAVVPFGHRGLSTMHGRYS